MKHIDWNYGVLDEIFGTVGKGKTIKTLCEVRVNVSQIDNHNSTCEACKRIKQETEALAELLKES